MARFFFRFQNAYNGYAVVSSQPGKSENQKRLLREFDEESSQKNNPESSGFFSKVKDFWDGLT